MPKPNVLIKRVWLLLVIAGLLVFLNLAYAQQEQRGQTSYMKVDSTEPFAAFMARMAAAKPGIAKEHNALLSERYDLSDRPAKGVAMDRGKPLQEGVRVKLPAGMTWDRLAAISADQIREQNLYPKGFYPLPHPKHTDGGFVFPRFLIDAIKQQDGRDLTRFDIDFDLPDHFLAEFPPAMYLTPRPDLGDVSQGKLVSLTNYYELFNGLLTPRQLEGLRLLLTPFPQQQFNATEDRRSAIPSIGSACFDCHSNGHQNGATHLAPDTRPQQFRHRIKTLSLRGVDIQRLFGSGQCASCHQPPFYTDNLMHNLQTERFFKPVMINNMMAIGDGPIKTFALRGVKDNPPYMHDERLLTLEDTVEFFNLILGTKLAPQEKQDLVAFLRTL